MVYLHIYIKLNNISFFIFFFLFLMYSLTYLHRIKTYLLITWLKQCSNNWIGEPSYYSINGFNVLFRSHNYLSNNNIYKKDAHFLMPDEITTNQISLIQHILHNLQAFISIHNDWNLTKRIAANLTSNLYSIFSQPQIKIQVAYKPLTFLIL